jgi:phosphoesterase RecJ-like protein
VVDFVSVKEAIDNAKAITILSHLNPDADTLGTALGIYSLLIRDKSKKIEVVNASGHLPMYLDFLPYYQKIKHQIEYEDSLIITCDCGSLDRLGFDVSEREIINIDHHKSNTNYGTINIVVSAYASASQVAFELFHQFYTINKESATCFYTALLSDTQYFTTDSVTENTFDIAKVLIALGAKPAEIAYHFRQRKPLSALRILEKALGTLSLDKEAKVASIYVTQNDILATGATIPDMEGLVDYAKSLATVEIAICAIELPSSIRISLRSKSVDVSQVAIAFGGGGHKLAAGFSFAQYDLQESIDIILQKIEELALLEVK